jgi:Tol biopolymer transport system component
MTLFEKSDYSRSSRSISFAVLLLVALVVSACGGDSRSGSADIIYSAEVEGNIDVFKLGEEFENAVRLTSAVGDDFAPAWSPNKETIAFLSDRNGTSALWLMDAAGDSKRQVSAAGVEVARFRWSPDSTRIGIEIVNGGVHTVEVLDTETDTSTSVTSAGEDVRVGDWSPDGEWLVYSVIAGDNGGIMRRNPTGVDEIVLVTGQATNPRWSRNGQWIAFNRVLEDGSVDLVVMNKDGDNETIVASGVSEGASHDWAPDSKHIVYVSEVSGNAEIYVVKPDGKNTEQLTSNRVADAAPTWSANGESILFLSEGDGSYDVYSMSKDGEQQIRKTTIPDLIINADW